MKEIKHLIGDRVRQLRIERGITQEELGKRAGMHHTYVGAIERGEKNCTVMAIARIAEGLQVGINDLFDFVEPEEKTKKDLAVLRKAIISEVNKTSPKTVKLISDLLKNLGSLTHEARVKK